MDGRPAGRPDGQQRSRPHQHGRGPHRLSAADADHQVHHGWHDLKENDVLVRNMHAAIDAGKAVHLMGLLGTGGVHSHIDHLLRPAGSGQASWARRSVYVHCIMDGRDDRPAFRQGLPRRSFEDKLDELGVGEDCDRRRAVYYAMDRDYQLGSRGKGVCRHWSTARATTRAIALAGHRESYELRRQDVTDEFVVPCRHLRRRRACRRAIRVVFFNFRPDRARQITRTFVDDGFQGL